MGLGGLLVGGRTLLVVAVDLGDLVWLWVGLYWYLVVVMNLMYRL